MKIVLFNKQEKAGGGIGVFTKRLREFLVKHGHTVFEIRYTNEPESSEFAKVPYLYADRNTFIFIPHLNSKKIIEDHLERIKPDLVYLPIGSSVFDLYMPRICRSMGIKLMGVCHTDISRSTKLTTEITSLPFRFYLPVAKRVGTLQVFTAQLKEFYVQQGVNPEKIVVIPNGVEEKKYSPGNSQFKNKNEFGKAVLFVGRMTSIKNPEILIKSFLEVADQKTKLFLMGKGDLLSKLQKKYSNKRIVFLGQINDEKQKVDVIRGCDIFVLPSWYEGMSLSLLEAMSCGLCCITSDVASHKEVLEAAGIVISSNKLKEQLPIEIKKCLDDEKLRSKLGEAARQRILRDYTQIGVFERIENEFIKLTS